MAREAANDQVSEVQGSACSDNRPAASGPSAASEQAQRLIKSGDEV